MTKKAIKEVDAHVGSLVRNQRMAVGLSQEKLGEAIGVTFQQVQNYEAGFNRISSGRLMQIANAIGVPPTFFFVGAPTAVRISERDQKPIQDVEDFVASKDGVALMKAFAKLPAEVRRSVVNLVEKVAENE